MNLLLSRHPATDDTILGQLFLDGRFECFTCEGSDVAIPEGAYGVTITRSQTFGRMLPLLTHVPGRTGIRIHSGNTEDDTDGCILVGRELGHQAVLQSRDALASLQSKLAAALSHQEEVVIVVQNYSDGSKDA